MLPPFPQPHARHFPPAGLALPRVARDLARRVADQGGRAVVVGGYVRDLVLGIPAGDVDLEIYGIPAENLENLVLDLLPARAVGRDFGILKAGPLDVSLPRSERGGGREGFLLGDPFMPFLEAARRRDFTLNAMALDPLTGDLFDPFGGVEDLAEGRLRHVDDATFVVDPLRALRAIQLLARLPLRLDDETAELIRQLAPVLPGLPRERLFEEIRKLMIKGRRVGYAMDVAAELGLVHELVPELCDLRGCPQDAAWHPEGDVWEHTCLALDVAARGRTGHEEDDLTVMLAVLFHDIGKPDTTTLGEDGHIRTPAHEPKGARLTRQALQRLTAGKRLVERVVSLVQEHMKPGLLFQQGSSDAAIRRLSTRVSIELVARVARADHLGRTLSQDAPESFPAGDWLLARAEALGVLQNRPMPLVQGRHLLSMGYRPGAWMGELLDQLYEEQLDGLIADAGSGLARARELLSTGRWQTTP